MSTTFIVPTEWRESFLNEYKVRSPLNPLTELESGFFQSAKLVSAQLTSCLLQTTGMQIVPIASIQKGASEAAKWITTHLAPDVRWNLVLGVHATSLKTPARSKRTELLENAILTSLKKDHSAVWKLRNSINSTQIIWGVVLPSGELALTASKDPNESFHLPGARAVLKPNPEPPSRAFQKLQEGFQRFDYVPSSKTSAVDLGAAPGGWTWEVARHGAKVVSVDRAPLDKKIESMPNVRALKADAMKYRPENPVDLLVCDVIAFPEQSLKLLLNWVAHGWCSTFFVTFKFKREPDWKWIQEAHDLLKPHCARLSMRHLEANKNEIMVMGQLKSPR